MRNTASPGAVGMDFGMRVSQLLYKSDPVLDLSDYPTSGAKANPKSSHLPSLPVHSTL